MMGTHQRQADHHHHQHNHDDHGVIQSSIALLQERFKQLQRVKEMREKKELLRIFSNHHNINNNNNNNPSTTILSTSTTTTATISNTDTKNLNSSNNIPRGTGMQYNYHHEPCSNDDGDDKELQVFLPPNYYNHKPSSYSSPSPSPSSSSSSSSSSSASPSSSSSLSSNNNYEVSLSLWPSTPPCNVTATADQFQRATSFIPPTKDRAMGRPCVTRAFKIEDSHHHVSDVDTTLHL